MGHSLRIWRWFFDVSNPHDPKLRGWLHPTCALAFNLSLAFLVAGSAFLAAPPAFHGAWMKHQPQAVLYFAEGAAGLLDNLKGVGIHPPFLWLWRTVGNALLPDKLLFDQEQAFALYEPEEGGFSPRTYGTFLAIYLALMLASRLYEKGPVMLYDAAWACNLALALTAVALWLNIPFIVSASSCWIAVDQLLWYVDCISYIIRGRFLVGVAKYIAHKDTPWTKKLFSSHHLWFIPFTTYINLKNAAGHSPCCLSVSMFLSFLCVLGSRCCTPYAVCHPQCRPSSSEEASGLKTGSRTEKGTMDVLNVNVSWRCWADVTHHLPFLGMFDDKPWYMFVLWNQLVWGLGNCILFGMFLTVSNLLRR